MRAWICRSATPCGAAWPKACPSDVEFDIDIERVRQLLPNSRVAELTQHYHLQYNAVSARFVLRNDNSGQQESLGTIDAALEQLSEIRDLPVLDKSLIQRRPPLRGQRSRQARLRHGAVHAADHDVLGQRLASRKRLVHMDIPALTRKYGSTVLGGSGSRCGWRAVLVGACRAGLRRSSRAGCPGSCSSMSRAVRRCRAAGDQADTFGARLSAPHSGFALKRPHRRDLQLAGRGAHSDGVLLLAAVPESRHRQLVRDRGQSGTEGHA